MIEIYGLTLYQQGMLDRLWSINSREEIEEWMSTLSESDQLMAQSLAELLTIEYLDVVINEQFTDYGEVRDILHKIFNSKMHYLRR
jgi:hypothetical protein